MECRERKKYNLTDIAALAGVAPSTVSRVLNGKDIRIKVSSATRAKILHLVKEFDYSPDVNARRLWTGRSNTIGLAVPVQWQERGQSIFSDHPFTEMMGGIEHALSESNYRLMLIFQNDVYFRNREYIALLKTKVLDGTIIWGAVNSDSYIGEIADFPVIVVNTEPKPCGDFNYIGNDNARGSYELTRAMLHRGARRFGYLGGIGESNSIGLERFSGFKRALEEAGLVPHTVLECMFRREAGAEAMKNYLRHNRPEFDVLVCASDELAFGAYVTLKKFGLRVPDDLVLTGADGVGNFSEGLFPLPTYRVPAAQVGERAVKELLRRIDDPGCPKIREILPVKQIIPKEFDAWLEARRPWK